MSSRPALVIPVALTALVLAACSAAGGSAPTGDVNPATGRPSTPVPALTPVPNVTPLPNVTPAPQDPEWGDAGDVEGGFPELSIEMAGEASVQVTLVDPEAKAWRLSIAGTRQRAGDALELLVETGDVGPVVTMRELRDGAVVDVVDLTGTVGESTAAAGGCHATLPVCLGSDGIVFPDGGDGTLRVRLDLPTSEEISITGATAGWEGEPFVLGPWEQTEPFVWPMG